jgi:hypothetical protein
VDPVILDMSIQATLRVEIAVALDALVKSCRYVKGLGVLSALFPCEKRLSTIVAVQAFL